jgi:hypothetical protein
MNADSNNTATMSLTLVGGLGPILGVFFAMYTPQGKTQNQIVWLSTMPSLFVGIGKEFTSVLGSIQTDD